MANYKIKVKIEMVECQDAEEEGRRRRKDGRLELTMSEQQAISIDACEKALLATSYEAMREAISAHLTAVSKKNPRARQGTGLGDP
jgi:hypothetical protein